MASTNWSPEQWQAILDHEPPAASPNGKQRFEAHRLMLPGLDDPDIRRSTAIPLGYPVQEILDSMNGTDYLELLGWSGKEQEEQFLVEHSKDNINETAMDQILDGAQDPTQTSSKTREATFDEFTEQAVSAREEPVSSSAKSTQNTLKKSLPGDITLEVCDIDLSPLGSIPIPTARLLVPPGRSLTSVNTHPKSALYSLIEKLAADRVPHIYGIIIEKASRNKPQDYLITMRIAVFDENYGVASEHELGEHIRDTYEYSPSRFFDGPVTDNFELPLGEYLAVVKDSNSNRYQVRQRYDYPSARPGSIEDLVTGVNEYHDLLRGANDRDDRYNKAFDAFARIPVKRRDLLHFCILMPIYYEFDCWGRVLANPPRFSTEGLGSRATETETRRTFGTNTERTRATDSEESGTDEESEEHREMVNHRIRFRIRNGFEIIAVDQSVLPVDIDGPDPTENDFFDGDSQPDIVCRKDGQIHIDEIEIGNGSKPASLLVNLARAAYQGIPVTVVAPDKGEAASKLKVIEQPYRETTATRIRLYNWTRRVHRDDGVGYLLPKGVSTAKWWLTEQNQLKLIEDGKTLAEGAAEDHVKEFDYNTPRYREHGNKYIVEDAHGNVIDTYRTKEEMLEDYTQIRVPFVPSRLDYFPLTEIQVQKGETYKRYNPMKEWTWKEKASIRYELAADDYLSNVTVEKEGAELLIDEIRPLFLKFYRARTDLSEPNDTWFGRAINAYYEVDASDTHNKKILGRALRYEPGLVSKIYPFVDADSDESDSEETDVDEE